MTTLDEVVAECSVPDWDAYGAKAVSAESVDHARRLAKSLPKDVPEPDYGCDPDGHVNMDWLAGPQRMIGFCVTNRGAICGALKYGGQSWTFVHDSPLRRIPASVIKDIRWVNAVE